MPNIQYVVVCQFEGIAALAAGAVATAMVINRQWHHLVDDEIGDKEGTSDSPSGQ